MRLAFANRTLLASLALAGVAACSAADAQPKKKPRRAVQELPAMKLESPSFADQEPIPIKHTCEGEDIPPALVWSGLPSETKSLALIVDDPDAPDPAAPKMTWVHWVLFDLPPQAPGLPEGGALPPGTREGLNDWKRTGYGGPCPPIGRHRYYHKLYALDAKLDLQRPTKAELEAAMAPHVLARATLVGTYEKQQKKP